MFYDLTYTDVEKEYRKHDDTAGLIEFPAECKVKIIPPFGGAMGRFRVYSPDESSSVSVYMDCHDNLGYVGQPYWEIYPNKNDDCSRFLMGDELLMIQEIKESLGMVDSLP